MGWENSLSWAEYCCTFRPIFDERHHLNTKAPPPSPPSRKQNKNVKGKNEKSKVSFIDTLALSFMRNVIH